MKTLPKILLGLLLIALGALTHYAYVNDFFARTLPAPAKLSEVATTTETKDEEELCIQVITPARNPQTGAIVEFPTPCDVPDGWEIIENDIPSLDLELE